MAKIGLNNFFYAILKTENADGTVLYDEVKKPGKAVECQVEPENYDASLYADDALAESVKGFKNASVTLTIDEYDKQVEADLLGHTLSDDGEITYKSSDEAPYVGIGRVVKKIVSGKIKYRAVVIYKNKFSEPSVDENTQGDDLDFGTTELAGTASTLSNDMWQSAKEFDSRDEAIKYIKEKLPTSTTTSAGAKANTNK